MLFLSPYFIIWEILNLNLTFAACCVRDAKALVYLNSWKRTNRNSASIQPATSIGFVNYYNTTTSCNSKVRPKKLIILRELQVIFRSWNWKRNVGPKAKDFVTPQFYPELLFCWLWRSILVIFFFIKMEYQKNTLTLTTLSYRRLLFGYYSVCRWQLSQMSKWNFCPIH